MSAPEITAVTCPPRCDGGGTPADGGHVFDHEVELRDGDRVTGWSKACSRCGITAMDWTLMRPALPRNEILETCANCEHDEAEGGLVDQCETCKRKNAAKGSLMVGGEWHDVYVTTDGAVRDGCDFACNGKVYVRANKHCIQTVNVFGNPLPKAFWKCDEGSMHFGLHVAKMANSACAASEAGRRTCEHHEPLYEE